MGVWTSQEMKFLAVPLLVEAQRVSCNRLIALAMRNSEILERSSPLPFFQGCRLVIHSRGWGNELRGVYCELSLLALEPAVRTRILESGEASPKFWVDQPGSRVALILFAESEQSSCRDGKPNLVWELYF